MGQNQSIEEDSQDIRSFTNNYVFVKKFMDTRYSEVKLLQDKSTGNKILQKEYTSHAKKDFHEYLQQFKKRTSLNHPNILKIFGYTNKKEDSFCGDFFKVLFYFEYFDYDLEQEIHRRIRDKDNFPETELWYILDSIVSAGAYFQTNKIEIGDIKPSNILITPSIDYKIVDKEISGKASIPSYFGSIQAIDSKAYLAPEIFKNIPKNKKPEISIYKACVFSLGMSLIEAANLEDVIGCYDWDNFTYNENHLKNALNKVRGLYGDDLTDVLYQMTHITEDQRYDFLELDKLLNVRRAEIRARFINKNNIIQQIEVLEPIKVHETKEEHHHHHPENEKSTGIEKHHFEEPKLETNPDAQTPSEVIVKEEIVDQPLTKEVVQEIIRETPKEIKIDVPKVGEQVIIPPKIEEQNVNVPKQEANSIPAPKIEEYIYQPQGTYQITQHQPTVQEYYYSQNQQPVYTTYISSTETPETKPYIPPYSIPSYFPTYYESPKYEYTYNTYQYPTTQVAYDTTQPIMSEYKYESSKPIQEVKYEPVQSTSTQEYKYEIYQDYTKEVRYEPVKQAIGHEIKHEVISQPPMYEYKYETYSQQHIKEYKYDTVTQAPFQEYKVEPYKYTQYEYKVENVQPSSETYKYEPIIHHPIHETIQPPIQEFKNEINILNGSQYNYEPLRTSNTAVNEVITLEDQALRAREGNKDNKSKTNTKKAGVQKNKGNSTKLDEERIINPGQNENNQANSPIFSTNIYQYNTNIGQYPLNSGYNSEANKLSLEGAFDVEKYLAELGLQSTPHSNIPQEENIINDQKVTIINSTEPESDYQKFLQTLGIQNISGNLSNTTENMN